MWKIRLTTAILCLAFIPLSLCLPRSSAWSSTSLYADCEPYDDQIHVAVKRWWPDLQIWRLWRAQIFAESRCNTAAVSAVGAAGLVQLMPKTATDLAKRLNTDPMSSPHDSKFAIPAGAAYMASLRYQWRRE